MSFFFDKPSRSYYTEEKLKSINGTPNIDKCIKNLFAPVNFIERVDVLDKCITDLNQYLAFDDWQVIRKGTEITFTKSNGVDIDAQKTTTKTEKETISDFLTQEFSDISISDLSRRPNPEVTGAVQHSLAALECLK